MKTNKVFVAGIAYRDQEGNQLTGRHGDQKLAELFGRAGKIAMKKLTRRDGSTIEVVAANIAVDKESKLSRGFGFVEMATAELAEKAVAELNEKELDGRNIRTSIAMDRPEGDRN
jgi:RNA recognition motif-containing protein